MRLTPKESEIQKAILEGLQAHKIFAFRLNTAAMKVGTRFFRAHSLGKGAPDIVAFPRPWTNVQGGNKFRSGDAIVLFIECKTPSGKLSFEQESFQAHAMSAGCYCLTARSWDDVERWLGMM